MQAGIHPEYSPIVFNCSCGNTIETASTLGKESFHIDVCAKCHPFYTGKSKVSTAGNISKFKSRFAGIAPAAAEEGDASKGKH